MKIVTCHQVDQIKITDYTDLEFDFITGQYPCIETSKGLFIPGDQLDNLLVDFSQLKDEIKYS